MAILETERLESFKAGAIAGFSFFLSQGAIIFFNTLVLARQFSLLAQLQVSVGVELLVRVAIALVSGFLFGVTYRYIILDNQNPYLKDGAVFAFGLVRGLALLEGEEILSDRFWSSSILGIEGIISFAIARLTLDIAMQKNLLKPFQ